MGFIYKRMLDSLFESQSIKNLKKKENYIIIAIYRKPSFDKTQHSYLTTTVVREGIEGRVPDVMKDVDENVPLMSLNSERLNVLSSLVLSVVLGTLTRETAQEKEMKGGGKTVFICSRQQVCKSH